MGTRSVALAPVLLVVGLALWTSGQEGERPRRNSLARRASVEPVPEGASAPSGAATRISESDRPPTAAVSQTRMAWLLDLPDAELAVLVGTKTLDGYVAEVLTRWSEREDEASRHEIGRFLDRLNARIRARRAGRP